MAHHLLHVLGIEDTVDEMSLEIVVGRSEHHDAVVGQRVELGSADMTALAHLTGP